MNNHDVDVYVPRGSRFWQELILGDFNKWVKKQIEPTLQANKEKYDTQRNTAKTESC